MELYATFLQEKDQTNIWRKAKQREFTTLDHILLALEHLETLTVRNSMTLRMLGIVTKAAEEGPYEVALTDVGEQLLRSTHQQRILDEQLLKIYLDTEVNNRLHIPIFPVVVLYEILDQLGSLSFDEYSLFVCWINSRDDKNTAIELIKSYREAGAEKKREYHDLLNQKTKELNYLDFKDNIFRLFSVFELSSFLHSDSSTRWLNVLTANSSHETYASLISAVQKVSLNNYDQDDTSLLGLITVSPDFNDITREMSELTVDEQRLIKRELVERNKLPDISTVEPRAVYAAFIDVPREEKLEHSAIKTAIKIDYEKRSKRNRLVGIHGERVVVKYEYNKLVKIGRDELAAKVEHSSLLDDSLGYDVKSYTSRGEEKHIEVKTVTGRPRSFRFYISKNELYKVKNDPYHCIYIVLKYETAHPEILEIVNLMSLIESGTIAVTPVNFTVTVNLEYLPRIA